MGAAFLLGVIASRCPQHGLLRARQGGLIRRLAHLFRADLDLAAMPIRVPGLD